MQAVRRRGHTTPCSQGQVVTGTVTVMVASVLSIARTPGVRTLASVGGGEAAVAGVEAGCRCAV